MTATDHLLDNARRILAAGTAPDPSAALSAAPSKRVAIVACMDSRMDLFSMLGLELGEAHVIRNAGGIVTDDVVRSLVISQRRLGTNEVILVHHTDCGMLALDGGQLADELEEEAGVRPGFGFGEFRDLEKDVRSCLDRLADNPFLSPTVSLRGFVYDVSSGELAEVS